MSSLKLSSKLEKIEFYAFNGCFGLVELTIPASVSFIGSGAFSGCIALEKLEFASGSKLTEIQSNAFASCTMLKTLSLPDGITSIGFGAFGECLELSELKLPSELSSIGENAFYNAKKLAYLKLPSKLKPENINVNAFKEARNLFEICNLTGVAIECGSEGVAKYAISVTTSDVRSVEYASAGNNKYAKLGDTWYLYSVAQSQSISYSNRLVLPDSEVTDKGKVTGYILKNRALADMYGETNYYAQLVIPKCVAGIQEFVFNYASIGNIYYMGTEAEWTAVKPQMNVAYAKDHDYFYKECLHEGDVGRLWAYDSQGGITIEKRKLGVAVITKAATCTETGKKRRNYSGCSHFVEEDIPMTAHDYDATGVCRTCKQQKPDSAKSSGTGVPSPGVGTRLIAYIDVGRAWKFPMPQSLRRKDVQYA